MRRVIASGLLSLFALLLTGPAAFLPDPESNLPACCRRDGAHHCGQARHQANSSAGPQLSGASAPCPLFPAAGMVSHGLATGLFAPVGFHVGWVAQPADAIRNVTPASTPFGRAHQERGPPRHPALV